MASVLGLRFLHKTYKRISGNRQRQKLPLDVLCQKAYLSAMLHAYAYKADPAPLHEAGAEKLWYDAAPDRLQRADMMKSGALRRGDTLLVLSIHNLAGSPQAYERWQADIAERGITLRVVANDSPPRPVGRPRKYESSAEDWAIWTDGHRSEKDRLADIAARHGAPVTRQTLNGRYGNPTNPRPAPE